MGSDQNISILCMLYVFLLVKSKNKCSVHSQPYVIVIFAPNAIIDSSSIVTLYDMYNKANSNEA